MTQSDFYNYRRLRVDQDNQPFVNSDGSFAYHQSSISVWSIEGFEDGVYKTGIIVTSDERIPTIEVRAVHATRIKELKKKLKDNTKGEEE